MYGKSSTIKNHHYTFHPVLGDRRWCFVLVPLFSNQLPAWLWSRDNETTKWLPIKSEPQVFILLEVSHDSDLLWEEDWSRSFCKRTRRLGTSNGGRTDLICDCDYLSRLLVGLLRLSWQEYWHNHTLVWWVWGIQSRQKAAFSWNRYLERRRAHTEAKWASFPGSFTGTQQASEPLRNTNHVEKWKRLHSSLCLSRSSFLSLPPSPFISRTSAAVGQSLTREPC